MQSRILNNAQIVDAALTSNGPQLWSRSKSKRDLTNINVEQDAKCGCSTSLLAGKEADANKIRPRSNEEKTSTHAEGPLYSQQDRSAIFVLRDDTKDGILHKRRPPNVA
mmetsp:Transcript_20878/g.63869  ORF Transcript_20878/g.63869 Transcript_20878/m.63869 type:complete len:109 (-) Transcript_20878:2161-2487(-)|eukprot:scaffold70294_cov30-Tisochrysis_lutea.AAC.1